jgi:hypothetical protein
MRRISRCDSVLGESMHFESVGCAARFSMSFAARERLSAFATPSGDDLAFARTLELCCVPALRALIPLFDVGREHVSLASIGIRVGVTFEDVVGSLERGEVGSGNLDAGS